MPTLLRRSGFPSGLSAPAVPPLFERSLMIRERRETFGKGERIRVSSEFAIVKTSGVPLRGKHCMLVVATRPAETSKAGFIASKKSVGGSVQRNRARRRLREIVRRRWPRVPSTGYWLLFIAFRTSITASHQDLATDVERLLAQAGALSPTGTGSIDA